MEQGFYHPDRGYWQTTGQPNEETLMQYPNGTVEVPIRPSEYHDIVDGAWVDNTPTPEIIAAELEARRIAAIKSALDNQNSVNKVLLKISFLQENRIRVLEGNPEITADQFRTWVDGQID